MGLYVGNKTFDFSSKKKDFLPKNDQIWPKTGIFGQFGPGHAGLFSALLVGWWLWRAGCISQDTYSLYVGNKTFDFSSKKKDFLPKNDQIWPKIGIFGQFGPGHAGLFSALLAGRLVVVARGLYLARHLFTLLRDGNS